MRYINVYTEGKRNWEKEVWMSTVMRTVRLEILEVLYGKKTTLVCKRNDIPQTGSLRITDLHGNVHIEKFTLSMPKQCFSSKDIMFLNIDDTSVTLDSKVEYEEFIDR